MARTGFNFRSTSGYVTDASGDIYVIITDAYPTTRSGVTFGWLETGGGGASDIDSAVDARLAGYHYVANTSSMRFQIDLTGTAKFRVAAGDKTGSYAQQVSIRDNATEKFNVTATNTAGKWYDATSAEYNAASWPGSNAQSSSYTISTHVKVYIGGGGGGSYTTLAHIEFDDTAGGATTRGMPFGTRGTAFNGGRTFTGVIR